MRINHKELYEPYSDEKYSKIAKGSKTRIHSKIKIRSAEHTYIIQSHQSNLRNRTINEKCRAKSLDRSVRAGTKLNDRQIKNIEKMLLKMLENV